MDLADDLPAGPGPVPTPRQAPPLDPELAAVLERLGPTAREPVTPENLGARQERDAAARPRPTVRQLRDGGRFEAEELRVPGPPNAPDVTLVAARPAGIAGPLPLLYYLHGGGMITGNAWSVLPRILREWAEPLGPAVVSAEYRLAPGARYPAAVEDCYAGLLWVAAHAADLGVDPDRIVIGGKSAGGGLAAALALLTRDRRGPRPAGQLLMCPMLDDRNDTVSSHPRPASTPGTGYPTRRRGRHCSATGTAPPTCLPMRPPARAADLSGLPPAYLDVGSAETLRDEAAAYAQGIWQAGGQAELHVWPGAFHGFDTLAPAAALSRDARDARTRWLRRVLART
ncbi:alpha/beta hydrolase [Streptomyces sp. NPDC048304]|uniref:alpha/beta hydrolase n=1 Tax=Streptomyces sp. NPDC048304 TaxID=3154820 RepID=UPI0033E5CCF9